MFLPSGDENPSNNHADLAAIVADLKQVLAKLDRLEEELAAIHVASAISALTDEDL